MQLKKYIFLVQLVDYRIRKFIYLIFMKKKSQTNINTERIAPKKQLQRQKERQKTIPLLTKKNKKIMLTDLCSEQKLKIGQLIKALQVKKQQNEQLTQSLQQLTDKYYLLQNSYKHIEFKYLERQLQLQVAHQKINKMQRDLEERIRQNKHLLSIQEKQQFYIKQAMEKQTISVGTSIVQELQNYGTQTKEIKTKNAEVQVQLANISYSLKDKQHSKSFQRIMKGNWSMLQKTNSRSRNKVQISSHEKQDNTPRQIEYEIVHQSYEINQQSEQSLDQSYEELAKKWKELKSKNPLIIKNSGKSVKEQKQRGHVIPQFKLKQQNKYQRSNNKNDFNEIDQIELNKMLKSKDFSISKLINVKSSHRIENSDNRSKEGKSPEINNMKKSPYFNYESQRQMGNTSLNVDKKTILAYSDKSSKQDINFFESDIIEIAQSMQQL